MVWVICTPAFQFWFGVLGAPGKPSIAFGSVSLYWPVANSCGNATARVCTTTPYCASRSFFALRIVAFCASAMFSESASESGRVSHDGELVSASCAEIFRLAAEQKTASDKMIFIFFMGKMFSTLCGGELFHRRQRKFCDVFGQMPDACGVL